MSDQTKDIPRKKAARESEPPPLTATDGVNTLDRTAQLTRALIQVPKDEVVPPKKKRK